MEKEGEGAEERQPVRRREGWTVESLNQLCSLTKVINPGAIAVLRGVLYLLQRSCPRTPRRAVLGDSSFTWLHYLLEMWCPVLSAASLSSRLPPHPPTCHF